jgi:hypothetical protein
MFDDGTAKLNLKKLIKTPAARFDLLAVVMGIFNAHPTVKIEENTGDGELSLPMDSDAWFYYCKLMDLDQYLPRP